MYNFKIIKGNEIRIVSKETLAEALRSRHSYKKSPHFKTAFIGRVYYDDVWKKKITIPPANLSIHDIVKVH